MSSLADLPELVGFFSYSRDDDEAFRGGLSALRDAISRELSAQLGRTKRDFRLFQDREAIAPGKLWETEIADAASRAVFFIPIVTPRSVGSKYCKYEFESFLRREEALGRRDLIFPIVYLGVPQLEDEAVWRKDPVLSVVGLRQYVDWRPLRHVNLDTAQAGEAIENFCGKIAATLRAPWLSREDIAARDSEAARQAEEDKRRQEEAARAQAESETQRLAARRAEEERRRQEETPAARIPEPPPVAVAIAANAGGAASRHDNDSAAGSQAFASASQQSFAAQWAGDSGAKTKSRARLYATVGGLAATVAIVAFLATRSGPSVAPAPSSRTAVSSDAPASATPSTPPARNLVAALPSSTVGNPVVPASANDVEASPEPSQAQPTPSAAPGAAPAEPTRIEVVDENALRRLLHNHGVTLQWIDSDDRPGKVSVRNADGYVTIKGGQSSKDGKLDLAIDGFVTYIDSKRFDFVGAVTIRGNPPGEYDCARDGKLTFLITKNRKYWRMQQMMCPGRDLTDYVDIFF